MAAITTLTQLGSGWTTLRNVAAQATTGQTDWCTIPSWARNLWVVLNITANAGTTPTTTLTLVAPEPVTLDDTNDLATALTGAIITAASAHHYHIGRDGDTGLNDSATADAYQSEVRALQPIIGIRVTNDRGTGDETYTYTLAARVSE